MNSKFNSKLLKYSCLLIFLKGCAYFNTFYNAEQHFQLAERIRIENLGKDMPSRAIQEYARVIEKSDKIFIDYPESKYFTDALILKGKSHYFRREYDSAELIFNELIQRKESKYQIQARYWLALCKWKDRKPIPAINELERLINDVEDKNFQSNIYLSIGEIYLSLNDKNKAFKNFDKGAKLSKNRNLREQIYFQIAEILFDEKNYDSALDSYQKVLKNTVSLSRIQDSNLKIIQIYRLTGDLNKSADKIKQLIVDDDFSSIKPDLDFELVKIEYSRGKVDFAIENFDRIGQDYKNTQTSIEAYYMLSEIYLSYPNINFEKANFFMNEAMRQNINSPLKVVIGKKRNDVEKLIELDTNFEQLTSYQKAENLFISGQIIAFNLANYNEAKIYFDKIVKNFSDSSFYEQSIFALYIINKKLSDDSYLNYKNEIFQNYPNSDFAKYIIRTDNLDKEHLPSSSLLEAEKVRKTDLNDSINLYKQVLKTGNDTESSKIAAYFLGIYYDYEISQIDSAKFYYNLVAKEFPLSEQGQKASKRLEIFYDK